jgi:putative thiamine transport system permease protein
MGTLGPALGYMPALGATAPDLQPLRAVLDWPGLGRAMALSLGVGLASTLLSLAIVTLIAAGWSGTRVFGAIERALAPLLAVPHAAAAFGLAFLIAPSGWIARLLSPWATGWQQPPDLLIVQDPAGIALTLGLVAKEVPFLMLMTLAALAQARPGPTLTVARTLGYGRVTGWLKTIFPAVYRQIRLPVYAVLAYAMTVVDVAIILGPNTPPPLSVQVVLWMNDPDLALRLQAAAAAMVQLGLVIAALGLWRLAEAGLARLGRAWIMAGERGWRGAEVALRLAALVAGLVAGLAVALGLAGLALWSVAGLWPFPDTLPNTMGLRMWQRALPTLAAPAYETLVIAAIATFAALILALACLEAAPKDGPQRAGAALWLLYLPLIVPQIAFLPGLQWLALALGLQGGRGAVILAHLVFVLPYVFLALSGPWRAWDQRLGTVARALGASRAAVFWRVRLPMLLAPVLTAAAVGFAVSVGQYLPTLLIGAGRVPTLTTEAVALASGGDRRLIGVTGLAQALAALIPFALALALPRLVWRNRRGLRGG